MQQETLVVPAGYWRRFLALVIDGLIISACMTVVGVGLSNLTAGQWRIGNAIISYKECTKIDRAYPEIKLPADFQITGAGRCSQSSLGIPYDWSLVIEERTRSQSYSYARQVTVPLDSQGNVARPFYVDFVGLVAFVIYVLALEVARASSVGKRALRIRVLSLSGAKPSLTQSLKRLVRFGPLLPILAVSMVVFDWTWLPLEEWISINVSRVSYVWYALGLSAVLLIAMQIDFIVAVNRGRQAIHDKWAGTKVVRLWKSLPTATSTPIS